MTSRTIYLVSSRNAESQRAHFAIFVPAATEPDQGTLIEAVGAPMTGYILEFKRNYSLINDTQEHYSLIQLGEVDAENIVDAPTDIKCTDYQPRGNIEIAASQVTPPGISENFLAPVNDRNNKRCQEWTMEYIRHLVSKRLIASEAIHTVQSKRDPPNHGVGLQSTLRRSS
ncbi:hypothetical protein N7509_001808 [Penicillium cosmopolitanum]|uniref:Uncharacterized protein n=1 Tax=Penicillium cosmopolitanum TaxID=1131564 RepID=A0A9X0BCV1_9EURO|nr:uncharacterized protein N7509_001808 [Penicillium cosmopolitanum]KAJ5407925.1 hypothetical protein N7509_001808 [Penicillium cosmopolitanum]